MKFASFPPKVRSLPPYAGRFEAFRLPATGCEILFAVYPAGTEIPPHAHDTDNCGVITKGEMIIMIDGAETHYVPGDWYVVPAGVVHSARCEMHTEEVEFWFDSPGSGSAASPSQPASPKPPRQ
jgi:quercetin dioxygenase-like cupin family protein